MAKREDYGKVNREAYEAAIANGASEKNAWSLAAAAVLRAAEDPPPPDSGPGVAVLDDDPPPPDSGPG